MMTPIELAGLIDHTLLKPEATEVQIRRLVHQAIEHHFAAVCVNPRWIPLVRTLLDNDGGMGQAGNRPAACGCVGFPLGAGFSHIKAAEAAACAQAGADEVDMVAFLPAILAENMAEAQDDMARVVGEARRVNPKIVVKVILETAVLTEQQIQFGCRAARQAGADFVKTSTGFHPTGGASVQAVHWLKQYAGGLRVKASGGIRDLPTAMAMLNAGADRLGCSASVEIIATLKSTAEA